MKIKSLLFASSWLFWIVSCQEDRKLLTDTITSGSITVVADETYQPLLDSEKMVFEAQYPEAHINIVYKPALEVMKYISNDSIRILISSIIPDSSSLKEFNQKHDYFPTTSVLAKDAVAIIAHNSKKGIKLSIQEIKQICEGKITNFNQLKHGKQQGEIHLVFDNDQSSTLVYIQDSILKGSPISKNVYAQKTNLEVLNYVKTHPDALGIIGASWVSDHSDSTNLSFRKDIFPIEIGSSDTALYYYAPLQGYVASHLYPMRRLMQTTLKEGSPALGRGFVNFMSGEIGQKIVLKSGLVPAKVLTRVVQM